MKKIYLSKRNKKIYGVCGGIGEAFDIDPVLIRMVFILIAVMTAILPAVIAYLITAWYIIPKKY
ncbi:MAG: PspC domain-containing protein [Candidatus Pacebacteria bacterium]|nr:PspC domain-containing protein [Candidatus Paceibacterota bacterium]